ncbi:MAG: 50S ribosomal protein L10 [Saprospiraceae bacterium]|nr:50S ribosomal protein L10 [Saprospiraceae bacterium]
MTRTEKRKEVKRLSKKFDKSPFFYLTDSSELSVAQVNKLRGLCFEKGVEMKVVKNTLAIKAMETLDADRNFGELFGALKGPTAILFTETANVPAKIIKEFRKDNEKPILKAAYIDSSIYHGDDQVDNLAALKSKDELIGEIISLLEGPIQGVVSAISSGESTIGSLVAALGDRSEDWTPPAVSATSAQDEEQ